MSDSSLFQFLAGAVGGVAGEVFVFLGLAARGRQHRYNPAIGLLVVFAAGLLTVLNLVFIEKLPFNVGIFLNYGLFIALLAEHIHDAVRADLVREEPIRSGPVSAAIFVLAATPLVLNGFWQVYGVGTFGALLMEIRLLYRDRKKKLSSRASYWIITALAVLAGGGVAVLHGIESVSALLALQLGASTPLLGDQLWKGESDG
jgi:hypothetical protein